MNAKRGIKMLYQIRGGVMSPVEKAENDGDAHIAVLNIAEAPDALSSFVPRELMRGIFENASVRFEGHEDFDLLCLPMFHSFRELGKGPSSYLFIHGINIYIVCEECGSIASMLDRYAHSNNGNAGTGRLLCAFFEYLLKDDLVALDEIEERIGDLEDRVLTDKQENFTREIIHERKRLMVVMRYYEELLNVLEYVGTNEKHVFSSRSVRFLDIIHGKTQRLYDKAKTLREYVSEIREAYQAEVDIRMNNIMKILTVVTIIFMPLTLLVGWYGMNLKMPEYGIAAAYPIVIILSILVVVFGILFFKKHKWF